LFSGSSLLFPTLAMFLMVSMCAHALVILSGPALILTPSAPLAATLQVTTDVDSRVSVSVRDGTNTWQRNFYNYSKSNTVPLLGFKAGRTNEITVTLHDRYRNGLTNSAPLLLVTAPLPSDFPKPVLLASNPDKMEPGYTLFRIVNNDKNKAYLAIVDNAGEVVWYSGVGSILDVRQLSNGDLFLPLTSSFSEINMLGQTVKSWIVPPGLAVNQHDGVPTDHGTILYLNDASRLVTNFPTSATNPHARLSTTNVIYNRVIEISATNAALLKTWSPIDMLNPTRINYLSFTIRNSMGWDCEHANAVIEDPRDDSLIVSMRHQDAVIKFTRTGQLKWILSPHENWGAAFQPYLLNPVGTPFQWNYAQHAPMITPQGTLLIYDDGNFRASPFDPTVPDAKNYTRAVEYAIDEQTMEITQVWEYGRTNGEPLFTDRVGNADWLPQSGNVLITFGNVDYVNGLHPSPYSTNATMLRIKEVTHDAVPEVVFDLAFFDYTNKSPTYKGCFAYRSHRIPDLYSVLPKAVTDLTVEADSGMATLQFSGDGARTYIIEASTNLLQWDEIGFGESVGDGNFEFDDENSIGAPARYYRVVTQ